MPLVPSEPEKPDPSGGRESKGELGREGRRQDSTAGDKGGASTLTEGLHFPNRAQRRAGDYERTPSRRWQRPETLVKFAASLSGPASLPGGGRPDRAHIAVHPVGSADSAGWTAMMDEGYSGVAIVSAEAVRQAGLSADVDTSKRTYIVGEGTGAQLRVVGRIDVRLAVAGRSRVTGSTATVC